MPETKNPSTTNPIDRLVINTIGFKDTTNALSNGMKDFRQRPVLSAWFGTIYACFGLVFVAGLIVLDQIWMVVPAAIGFPLIAPFIAAGLYEMSRKISAGEDFSWRDILLVIFKQQRREFGWMAFVVLFVFWIWIYQIRLLLAIFLQWQSFSSLTGFMEILTTPNGILFLCVGTIVGGILATVLFSLTVIAMPLLLDREIDIVSAMIVSIKSVLANPIVMLVWGAAIAALVLIAILPVFLGVIFILPILGHSTWHLYKSVVSTIEPEQT